jgi:protein-L-isoaspartate(D-aspartate) O-methyltransferase
MFEKERWLMVEDQIHARGVTNPEVLVAMKDVPRHLFVPDELMEEAYEDHPVHIGFGQTISQPYIVALMLELAEPGPAKKLLEIGSGSGYLVAVASKLFKSVVGVERIEGLCDQSKISLQNAGIKNAQITCKDGYEGLEQMGPYDSIIVSCACPVIPKALIQQLAPLGVLVAPVGDSFFQELIIVRKEPDGRLATFSHCGVRFVPLISPHISELSGRGQAEQTEG